MLLPLLLYPPYPPYAPVPVLVAALHPWELGRDCDCVLGCDCGLDCDCDRDRDCERGRSSRCCSICRRICWWRVGPYMYVCRAADIRAEAEYALLVLTLAAALGAPPEV